MDVFEAIEKRHSYRGKFADAPVPKERLRKIVDAGMEGRKRGLREYEYDQAGQRTASYSHSRPAFRGHAHERVNYAIYVAMYNPPSNRVFNYAVGPPFSSSNHNKPVCPCIAGKACC